MVTRRMEADGFCSTLKYTCIFQMQGRRGLESRNVRIFRDFSQSLFQIILIGLILNSQITVILPHM